MGMALVPVDVGVYTNLCVSDPEAGTPSTHAVEPTFKKGFHSRVAGGFHQLCESCVARCQCIIVDCHRERT